MKRAVYIGGFGNGRNNAEGVATALEAYYDEIDPFTFSQAMSNVSEVRKAVHNVDVVTHSAGMLALVGTSPNTINAFGAPLPSTKLRLVGQTGIRLARMHMPGIGIRSIGDIATVANNDSSCTAELIAHPRRNLGNLGVISRFNAVDMGVAAQENGIDTSLVYTDGDEYFQLSKSQEDEARAGGVDVARLPGIHDELVLWPEETLSKYYNPCPAA